MAFNDKTSAQKCEELIPPSFVQVISFLKRMQKDDSRHMKRGFKLPSSNACMKMQKN